MATSAACRAQGALFESSLLAALAAAMRLAAVCRALCALVASFLRAPLAAAMRFAAACRGLGVLVESWLLAALAAAMRLAAACRAPGAFVASRLLAGPNSRLSVPSSSLGRGRPPLAFLAFAALAELPLVHGNTRHVLTPKQPGVIERNIYPPLPLQVRWPFLLWAGARLCIGGVTRSSPEPAKKSAISPPMIRGTFAQSPERSTVLCPNGRMGMIAWHCRQIALFFLKWFANTFERGAPHLVASQVHTEQ